jgi:hypothetical protein
MSSNDKAAKMKGRRRFAPALILRKDILDSPEWCDLSAYETKLIIDLASQYKGKNNGDLCAAWSIMKRRGWRSPGTLSKTLHSLIAKNWVLLTRQGGKHVASLYALTI